MLLKEEINTVFGRLIELAEVAMERFKQEVRHANEWEDYDEVPRLGRRVKMIKDFY